MRRLLLLAAASLLSGCALYDDSARYACNPPNDLSRCYLRMVSNGWVVEPAMLDKKVEGDPEAGRSEYGFYPDLANLLTDPSFENGSLAGSFGIAGGGMLRPTGEFGAAFGKKALEVSLSPGGEVSTSISLPQAGRYFLSFRAQMLSGNQAWVDWGDGVLHPILAGTQQWNGASGFVDHADPGAPLRLRIGSEFGSVLLIDGIMVARSEDPVPFRDAVADAPGPGMLILAMPGGDGNTWPRLERGVFSAEVRLPFSSDRAGRPVQPYGLALLTSADGASRIAVSLRRTALGMEAVVRGGDVEATTPITFLPGVSFPIVVRWDGPQLEIHTRNGSKAVEMLQSGPAMLQNILLGHGETGDSSLNGSISTFFFADDFNGTIGALLNRNEGNPADDPACRLCWTGDDPLVYANRPY